MTEQKNTLMGFVDLRDRVQKGDLKSIALDLGNFLEAKNADYAGASFRLGLTGVYVHLVDKLDRIESLLIRKHQPNFESLKDTFRDLAGYAIIALALYKIQERENAGNR